MFAFFATPYAFAEDCSSGKCATADSDQKLSKWELFEKRMEARKAKLQHRKTYRDANQYRRLESPGEQVKQNVDKLTKELKWFRSLEAAKLTARNEKKPILWVQALGELNGYL